MVKWADYLISEVSYDNNHLIKSAKRHKEVDQTISKGTMVDRLTIASDIKNNLSYITIQNSLSSWKKEKKIRTFRIKGDPYLRIDDNKVALDNLGELPEVNFDDLPTEEQKKIKEQSESDKSKQIEKPKIASSPEPKPEKLQSPRGSLPKDTSEELSQELELTPEPEAIPETKPEDEEATPDQINRFDQLKEQIEELESLLSSTPEPEPEATPEQLARLDKLEKQIEELESSNLEKKLIQKLEQENKKLDQIESNLNKTGKTSYEPKPQNNMEAYCVKCKQKRIVDNPQETTMKNGSHAVKGTCSECETKVFRIIKKK